MALVLVAPFQCISQPRLRCFCKELWAFPCALTIMTSSGGPWPTKLWCFVPDFQCGPGGGDCFVGDRVLGSTTP